MRGGERGVRGRKGFAGGKRRWAEGWGQPSPEGPALPCSSDLTLIWSCSAIVQVRSAWFASAILHQGPAHAMLHILRWCQDNCNVGPEKESWWATKWPSGLATPLRLINAHEHSQRKSGMHIPDICHGRHGRRPCKFFLPGVNFQDWTRKIYHFTQRCVVCNFYNVHIKYV